jgi:hypothetical protein
VRVPHYAVVKNAVGSHREWTLTTDHVCSALADSAERVGYIDGTLVVQVLSCSSFSAA